MSGENEAPTGVSRRTILKAGVRMVEAGLLVSAGGLGYGTKIEPNWPRLERIRVPLDSLPPAFDGFRIALLADIHLGPATKLKTISKSIQMALDLQADVVLLLGDFVTEWLDAPALYDVLTPLNAPHGAWTIMGNHDHWVDALGVRQVLEDAGIPELRNNSMHISKDGQQLWFVGVDDIWENKHDLKAGLENVPPDATPILLAHEPDYADTSTLAGRFGLQLSGHSHGGQVRIPFIGAPVLPYLGQKYPDGLRKVGDMWLYTSRGVGQNLSIRINCPPEVTEITLVRTG
jgi:predicted MPP superfamily phosphohydrolase